MTETVLLQRPSPGHARIVLNRAERRNALALDGLRGLAVAAETLALEPPRVLSIVADGPAFSVGGDIAAFADALTEDRVGPWLREATHHFHRAIQGLRSLESAIVVGAQGAAAGGALGLVWAADHVIVGDDLVLDLAYAKLGGSPDGGTSWFLPRLVNPLRAFELFSLSPRLDANRVVELGLANRVVPVPDLRAAVDDVVARWLAVAPETLRNFKRLLRDAPTRDLRSHLDQECEGFVRAGGQSEFAAAVAAFVTGVSKRG